MSITLDELARRIDATLIGDGSVEVSSCAPIQNADATDVAFLANPVYVKYLEDTRAGAVLIDPKTRCPDRLNRLVVDDPYYAFCNTLIELHGFRQHPSPMDIDDGAETRISDGASVHPTATVGAGSWVHAGATVEREARIGARCVLYPGAYVGTEAVLGDECLLYPNAVVYERCRLGDRVAVHANTVIGQDGFGYATHGGQHNKIPQTGVVVVEDDVEFGAGCAIERAAMGETRIGRGTKFADLVSIGHGTTIGEHCLLVSLVGISGSVDVGNYVVLGGQVGVTGHLRIGNGVQAAGKCAIVSDVPDGMKVGGVPAVELNVAKRNVLAGMKLGDLAQRVRQLERELERLKK